MLFALAAPVNRTWLPAEPRVAADDWPEVVTLRRPPALRAMLAKVIETLAPLFCDAMIELPAATVRAPRDCVRAAVALPLIVRLPPLSVIGAAATTRALLLAAVLSRTSVPPALTVTAVVAVSEPLAPLRVNVPALIVVPMV